VRTIQTDEVLNAVYRRRAIRKYTEDLLDPSLIEELIAAAIQAPSSMNRQPWGFVVIKGAARLRGYSDRIKADLYAQPGLDPILRNLLAEEDDIFHGAPYLIVVCATSGGSQSVEDCMLAADTLMVTAHAFGLGTCPIGLSRAWLSSDQIKREIGIPADWVPAFPLVLGKPDEHPEDPGRRAPRILWL
jgi:nitroreductase